MGYYTAICTARAIERETCEMKCEVCKWFKAIYVPTCDEDEDKNIQA